MDVSAIGIARWRERVLMRVDGQWIKEPTDGQWQPCIAGRSWWVGRWKGGRELLGPDSAV